MLMLKTTHDQIVAAKDAEIAGLMKRTASAHYEIDRISYELTLSTVTHREAHEAMTLLTCQLAEARARLAPFIAERKRDVKGHFVSTKGAAA